MAEVHSVGAADPVDQQQLAVAAAAEGEAQPQAVSMGLRLMSALNYCQN